MIDPWCQPISPEQITAAMRELTARARADPLCLNAVVVYDPHFAAAIHDSGQAELAFAWLGRRFDRMGLPECPTEE